jgi:hypothetical protein
MHFYPLRTLTTTGFALHRSLLACSLTLYALGSQAAGALPADVLAALARAGATP